MAAIVGEPGSGGQPETQQQVDYWNQVNNQWLVSEIPNRVAAFLETTEGKSIAVGVALLAFVLLKG